MRLGLAVLGICLLASAAALSSEQAVSSMCESLGMEKAPDLSRRLLSQKQAKAKHAKDNYHWLAPHGISAAAINSGAAAALQVDGKNPDGAFDDILAKAHGDHLSDEAKAKIEETKKAHAEKIQKLVESVSSSSDVVIKVGVTRYPPYAMLKSDEPDTEQEEGAPSLLELNEDPTAPPPPPEWTGYSVEVWKLVAEKNGWKYEFVNASRAELMKMLENGEIDTYAPGIFLTDNQKKVHPMWTWSSSFWQSGIAILVPTGEPPSTASIIFGKELWSQLGLLLLVLIGVGHVFWLLERDTTKDSMYDEDGNVVGNLIPSSWPQGAMLGTWWAAATATTVGYGDYYPTTWLSRAWGALCMLASLFIVGLWTGAITAALTSGGVGGVAGDINSLADLAGLPVAVIEGTYPHNFMKAQGTSPLVVVQHMPDAVGKLLSGEVKAVVGIADALAFSVRLGKAQNKAAMVGFPFRQHGMVFPVPPKGPAGASMSSAAITSTLLALQDGDDMDGLAREFFG